MTVWNDSLATYNNTPVNAKSVLEIIDRCASGARPLEMTNVNGLTLKIHQPRHANDHTLYVHMGNTVCEMSSESRETEELMQAHPEFFRDMLDYMAEQSRRLEIGFRKQPNYIPPKKK